MKTLRIYLLSMFCMLCNVSSWAYDFEVDGIYYNIISLENLEVAVTNNRDLGGKSYSGDIIIPETVLYKGKIFKVLAIGDYAFNGCSNLTSIDLGNVQSIGSNAFRCCQGLTTLDLKNVQQIYYDSFGGDGEEYDLGKCSNLVSIKFGKVTEIPTRFSLRYGWQSSFSNLPNLVSVDLEGVRTIESGAFQGCKRLSSIDLKDVTLIEDDVFQDCKSLASVNLPENAKSIADGVFRNTGLVSIDLKNVAVIGDGTFQRCSKLENIDLRNVKSIAVRAFEDCISLTSVELDSNITSIEDYTFQHTGLISVDLKNVRSIGNSAFSKCASLTSVDLKNVAYVHDYAFSGCEGLDSVFLRNVTTLGCHAFENCTGLKSVNMGNAVSIPEYSFENCRELTSVDFGDVDTVKYYAFKGCVGLRSIDLKHVKLLNDQVFAECKNIQSIRTNEKVPPEMYGSAFERVIYLDAILSVPLGYKAAYQNSSSWKNFFNIQDCIELGTRGFFLSCSKNGSVKIEGKTINDDKFTGDFSYGKQVTVDFIPDSGAKLKNVMLNGKDITAQVQNNSLVLTVDKAIEIEVFFELAVLNLDDFKDVYEKAADEECEQVEYIRNFDNTNWQALYIPFGLNYTDWSDDFQLARINNVHQYDDNNDGIVDRTVMEAFILPEGSNTEANMPYLIKAKTEGKKEIRVSNVLMKKAESISIDCSSIDYRYVMTGTYKGISGDDMYRNHYYTLNDEVLKQSSEKLGAFRWYLSVQNRKGNSAYIPQMIQLRVKDPNGDITGLEEMETAGQLMWPANIYDVQGKLVKSNAKNIETLPKGVYIINGKKYIK